MKTLQLRSKIVNLVEYLRKNNVLCEDMWLNQNGSHRRYDLTLNSDNSVSVFFKDHLILNISNSDKILLCGCSTQDLVFLTK